MFQKLLDHSRRSTDLKLQRFAEQIFADVAGEDAVFTKVAAKATCANRIAAKNILTGQMVGPQDTNTAADIDNLEVEPIPEEEDTA